MKAAEGPDPAGRRGSGPRPQFCKESSPVVPGLFVTVWPRWVFIFVCVFSPRQISVVFSKGRFYIFFTDD